MDFRESNKLQVEIPLPDLGMRSLAQNFEVEFFFVFTRQKPMVQISTNLLIQTPPLPNQVFSHFRISAHDEEIFQGIYDYA